VVAGTGAAVVNAAERDDVAGDGAVVQERSSDPTDPDVSATTTDASRTPTTTPTATTPADSPTSTRVPSPATPATQTAPSPPSPVTASPDRKSTRLNSSHVKISYAVFCLKK